LAAGGSAASPAVVAEPSGTYLGHLFLDPTQATFKGGQAEPLHSWFPFLEGYSPEFVRGILRQFSPDAKKVLDPFSGTGTTPLTSAGLGLGALFCELNPLLQFLIAVKTQVLVLDRNRRLKISEKFRALTPGLADSLRNSSPDYGLGVSYRSVFSDSEFFDPRVFELILKARTYADAIGCTDPLLATLFIVAVVSSLIPASRLIRAGDVRYKTADEIVKENAEFIPYVQGRIRRMADDLLRLEPLAIKPILLCEDARSLGALPSLRVDTVITSPPYLNGTNYFRNTKVELWFLRCLQNAGDLAMFRKKAITAGINDVTQGKRGWEYRGRISSVVQQLAQKAYDQRIPKMVSSYFWDMSVVFSGLRKHLVPGAVVTIDIGDSVYAGVRVATHELLTDLLKKQGYRPLESIQLRRRLSRDGTSLQQVLLLFSYDGKPSAKDNQFILKKKVRLDSWNRFKATLPHQKLPFSKRNWGHRLHSLCSYQGKMKPSLAKYLVLAFLRKPGIVLDPFAGVGTIPFESALAGHRSYGFEISPAARIIASAKMRKSDASSCTRILSDLERFIRDYRVTTEDMASADSISFNGRICDYYHERTLEEILSARRFFFQKAPSSPAEYLVMASLLHILHGNRPYALSRRSHPIIPFAPTGDFIYKPLIVKLGEKIERSLLEEWPEKFIDGKIFDQDATSWWPREISELDAIITSPPFFDSTRFHLSNWLRLWFCGWEAEDFKAKPLAFVDERQKSSFSVYESVFRQARERLKGGGVVVLHLGKSAKCDMGDELERVAAPWFRVADRFSETVSHCESHGIRDKGTVEAHQYLILK